jgi:hypothetical protein
VFNKLTIAPVSKDNIYAYVGIYDITKGKEEPTATIYNISRIAVHPKWDPQSKRFDSDIALLALYDSLQFTDFVRSVCLPDKNFQIGVRVGQVVGYGKSETASNEVKPKKTQIPSFTNDDCFFDSNYAQIGSTSTFCAGEIGKNPCSGKKRVVILSLKCAFMREFSGDSGGGFFIMESDWRIGGLVSAAFEQDCATNKYVLFTNVAKFVDWIQYEMTHTEDSRSDTSSKHNSFLDLDDEEAPGLRDKYQHADCTFELTR